MDQEIKSSKPYKPTKQNANNGILSVDNDALDFVADVRAATLHKKMHVTYALLYSIFAFVVVFVLWAHFAVLDVMTVGDGQVTPSSQIKLIQSLEGGLITDVFVKEGQRVKAGDVLIKLNDKQFAANFNEQRARYVALQATIARLTAEVLSQNKINFPINIQKEHPELVKQETRLFESRRASLSAALKPLNESYALAQKEYDMTKPLADDGVVSQVELLRSQRQLTELKGSLEAKLKAFQQDAQTDLSQKKSELDALEEAIRSDEDRLTRTTIRSPVNGTIKEINVSTIGQVIKPGESMMEIIPEDDTLKIKARITPADIGFLHPNQEATVKITAYDFGIYGGLKGRVEYISPGTLTDPKGESYYEVIVRTDRNYLGTKEHPLPIIPGMTASVHILTGQKTVLDYILKPLLKAKQNALTER